MSGNPSGFPCLKKAERSSEFPPHGDRCQVCRSLLEGGPASACAGHGTVSSTPRAGRWALATFLLRFLDRKQSISAQAPAGHAEELNLNDDLGPKELDITAGRGGSVTLLAFMPGTHWWPHTRRLEAPAWRDPADPVAGALKQRKDIHHKIAA